MLNNIQIEDMKQIKQIIIWDGDIADIYERYFKLVYKLRETITHLAVFRNSQGVNLHYLSELKSLTHLEIQDNLPLDIDFITILRLCPKLQSFNVC
jgi:hypothetical protein